VSNADFNGVNMVKSGGTSIARSPTPTPPRKITVQAQNLSLGGTVLGAALSARVDRHDTLATPMITTVNTAITSVSTGAQQAGHRSRSRWLAP
jgi:flagellin